MRDSIVHETQKELHLCYRRRTAFEDGQIVSDQRFDVFCAAFLKESDAKQLELKARRFGYLITWESIPLIGYDAQLDPTQKVFIVFQGGMIQDDYQALEFSDPVGIIAFNSKNECEAYISRSTEFEWSDVWILKIPWISNFALSPFKLERPRTFPDNWRFSS